MPEEPFARALLAYRWVRDIELRDMIVERYIVPMCAGLLSRYRTYAADADDAAQNAAIQSMRVLHLFDPCDGSAFNFFSTVIRNSVRDTDKIEARAKRRGSRACDLLNRN